MTNRLVTYLNTCSQFALALVVLAAGFSIAGNAVAASVEHERIISELVTSVPAPTVRTLYDGRVLGETVAAIGPSLFGKVITDGNGFYYYLSFDNKRYVMPRPGMPNSPSSPSYDVVVSWFGSITSAVTVSVSDLQSVPLGGNATLRPGFRLLQDESDVVVYAVTPHGVLRAISSTLLPTLYGTNWPNRVAIVPDAYFTNYTIGQPLVSGTYPDGSLIRYKGVSDLFLIQDGQKRKFTTASFGANSFQTSSLLVDVDSSFIFPNGPDVSSFEPALLNVAGPIGSSTIVPQTPAHTNIIPNTEHHEAASSETKTEATSLPSTVPHANAESYADIAAKIKEGNGDEVLGQLQILRNRIHELETENNYLKKLLNGVTAPTSDAQSTLNDFITYGVDQNTQALGAGERAAVLNSYKAAYEKLPETTSEFTDAIKIANGRWPTERSSSAEAAAKASFIKVYGREPVTANSHDNAAVTIMAYGLRQSAKNRNLKSETAGAVIFKSIFGHTPSTTEEWNIMQAITYSGATR